MINYEAIVALCDKKPLFTENLALRCRFQMSFVLDMFTYGVSDVKPGVMHLDEV